MMSKSKSSGSFCAAFGCGKCKQHSRDRHFFRFPKDKERSKRWVVNTRREDLLKAEVQYLNRNCTLCDRHFLDSQFMNASTRHRLIWNAVPTLFDDGKRPSDIPDPSVRRPPPNRSTISDENSPPPDMIKYDSQGLIPKEDHTYSTGTSSCSEPSTSNNTGNLVHIAGVKIIANKVVELQEEVCVLKKEATLPQLSTPDDIYLASLKLGMKPSAASFFHGQLRNCSRKSKGHRWTVKDRAIALGLLFKSRQAYRTISSLFIMPGTSTLYRYVSGFPTSPGVNPNAMRLLSIKVDKMATMSRFCVLTFDEMSLKKELRYNPHQDAVDGLVHLRDRKPQAANQALVYMVRGLAGKWKQPLMFFFSQNAASAVDLQFFLMNALEALMSIRLTPTAVVCDQGSCNRSLYRLMGISPEKPFFEVQENRVYALHDTPHILKNIRNTLKQYDIEYADGKVASWTDLHMFYRFDQDLPVRMAPRLTNAHIFLPPFSKMRVNLAAQVCSHTVYAGMQTLIALGKLPAKATETANFLKQVNDVFDILNVRGFKKGSKPLTGNEGDLEKLAVLRQQTKAWITKEKRTRQPCFLALLQNLNAVEMMSKDLVQNGDFSYILTGRINQDCLENFFSQVRGKGGHRFNPSAREFVYAYRALATNMLMKTIPSANCADDGDETLLESLNNMSSQTRKRKQDPETPDGVSAAKRSKLDTSVNSDVIPDETKEASLAKQLVNVSDTRDFPLTSAVSNVVLYIGGYIIRKFKQKEPCKDCVDLLTDNTNTMSEDKLFTHFKVNNSTSAFGSLYVPSPAMSRFLKRIEAVFQRNIEKCIISTGVLSKLLEEVTAKVPLRSLKVCKVHMHTSPMFVLRCYLKCRLHYYFKFQTRELLKRKAGARSRKLQVLQNK